MTEIDPFASMMGGNSARTARFDTVGVIHEGVIVDATMEHAREYIEGKPGTGDFLYWHNKRPLPVENDQPVMEPRITIQTTEREDSDDDGRRSITINKRLLKAALQKGVLEAGAKRPEIGGYIRFERIEDQPPVKGDNWARGWSVPYKTPAQHAKDGALTESMADTPAGSGKPTKGAASKPKPAGDPWSGNTTPAPVEDPWATSPE